MAAKYTLIMVRHGESEWNQQNLFCGWYDSLLSEKGEQEAKAAAEALANSGLTIDVAHTSVLTRANKTLESILQGIGKPDLEVKKTWRLNERHYGGLTGMNKSETAEKYGEEQVKIWRRSFDVPPPPMEPDHPYYNEIVNDPRYADGPSKEEFPMFESLKLTIDRTLPYWKEHIIPDLLAAQIVFNKTEEDTDSTSGAVATMSSSENSSSPVILDSGEGDDENCPDAHHNHNVENDVINSDVDTDFPIPSSHTHCNSGCGDSCSSNPVDLTCCSSGINGEHVDDIPDNEEDDESAKFRKFLKTMKGFQAISSQMTSSGPILRASNECLIVSDGGETIKIPPDYKPCECFRFPVAINPNGNRNGNCILNVNDNSNMHINTNANGSLLNINENEFNDENHNLDDTQTESNYFVYDQPQESSETLH